MERWLFRAVVVCGVAGVSVPAVAGSQDWRWDPSVPEYNHSLSLGGGAMGFVNESGPLSWSRAATWTLRYGYSPATPVTWELGYTGAMDLSPPDAPDQEQLFATMVEANLRINIIPMTAVYPFVAGGIGYSAFSDTESGVDLTTMSVPLAGGIEAMIDDVSLQTRFVIRPTYFDDDVDLTGLGADNWSLTASLGSRF
jgi:hypothetical protein